MARKNTLQAHERRTRALMTAPMAAFGVLLGAEFFGAMKFGGTRFDAPSEIVDIIMGCIVLCIAISSLLRMMISSNKKNKGGV